MSSFLQQTKLLLIGGKGRMGSLFAPLLSRQGYCVDILDRPEPISKDRVAAADVVLVCVPLEATSSVVEKILPILRPGMLVCDLASLKKDVCDLYASRKDIETVGFHPMFGPHVSTLTNQKVIKCPVRYGSHAERFCKALTDEGLFIKEMGAEQHDKMMAYIQVALHFTKVVMAKVFSDSGIPFKDTLASASPVYEMELVMLGRLFSQDPKLYAAIQSRNPYAPEVRQALIAAATMINDDVTNGDPRTFFEAFSCAKGYFSDFATEALNRSS